MSEIREQDYNEGFNIELWKKLMGFAKPYRKNMVIIGAMMIILAIIEVTFPIMTKYAIDNFVIPERLEGLSIFALLYILLVMFCFHRDEYL